MKHGQGVFRYGNGNVYTGQFRNNDREGRGHLKFASGDEYEGMIIFFYFLTFL